MIIDSLQEFRSADGASANEDDLLTIPYYDFDAGSDGRNAISHKLSPSLRGPEKA